MIMALVNEFVTFFIVMVVGDVKSSRFIMLVIELMTVLVLELEVMIVLVVMIMLVAMIVLSMAMIVS